MGVVDNLFAYKPVVQVDVVVDFVILMSTLINNIYDFYQPPQSSQHTIY